MVKYKEHDYSRGKILPDHLTDSLKLVILNANNYCNMHCSYCYETHATSIQAPSPYVLTLMSRLLASRKDRIPLLIHGGEPFLNSIDWFNLLTATLLAEDYDSPISIQTNASLLDDAKLRWIMANNIRLGISCDGPPNINDLTRGNSEVIEKTFKNLWGSNVPFGIIAVINKINYNHIEEILNYFEDQGASSIRLNRIFTTKGGLSISDYEYDKTISRAWNWAYGDMRRMRIYDICELEKSLLGVSRNNICNASPCGAGNKVISIDADGTLYPCNRLISKEYALGTLFSFNECFFEKFLEYKHRWFQLGEGACLAMSLTNLHATCFQRPSVSNIIPPFSFSNPAMKFALRYSSSNSAQSNWDDWSWDDYVDRG